MKTKGFKLNSLPTRVFEFAEMIIKAVPTVEGNAVKPGKGVSLLNVKMLDKISISPSRLRAWHATRLWVIFDKTFLSFKLK